MFLINKLTALFLDFDSKRKILNSKFQAPKSKKITNSKSQTKAPLFLVAKWC
jgi:hypothetical protein